MRAEDRGGQIHFLAVMLTAWLVIGTSSLRAAERTSQLGRQLEPFVLPDAHGKAQSWRQHEHQQWLIVAFLGTECPLAKHYAGRLGQFAQEYAPQQVAVLGVMSNSIDTPAKIRQFQELHQLTYPIVHDQGNRLADQFQAERTPEVFVLDAERRVRYHGRIDDQFQIGVIRDQPTSEDLKLALQTLLAGNTPDVPETEAIGCLIGRQPRSKKQSKITYAEHIAPLFNAKCVQCHRAGQAAPFELTRYEEARSWASMIAEVVREQRMPPWFADPAIGKFSNEMHLTTQEQKLIQDWVAAGAPLGDASKIPAVPQFPEQWLLPQEPDVQYFITKEPVDIPATGTVKYQYYRIDPKFTEDKWLKGSEVKPGNYAVVHHVLVFAREKGARGLGAEEGGFIAAYVPGLVPELYSPGMAKKIPAGSELIFQVHYTPIGSAQTDHSQLGLIFAEEEEITHQVVTSSAMNRRFAIPPHADNHEVTGYSPRSDRPMLLLGLMPHMHLRGKAFRYELQTPDGKQTPLLSVPRYDFNWQTAYRLQEPIPLPAGSRLACTAHFDNSEGNPFNPDPTRTVTWGDQTWEEMMIGYFDVAIPVKASGAEKAGFGSPAQQLIGRLDQNGDGELERFEIPEKWLPFFPLIDTDNNGRITLQELERSAARLQR